MPPSTAPEPRTKTSPAATRRKARSASHGLDCSNDDTLSKAAGAGAGTGRVTRQSKRGASVESTGSQTNTNGSGRAGRTAKQNKDLSAVQEGSEHDAPPSNQEVRAEDNGLPANDGQGFRSSVEAVHLSPTRARKLGLMNHGTMLVGLSDLYHVCGKLLDTLSPTGEIALTTADVIAEIGDSESERRGLVAKYAQTLSLEKQAFGPKEELFIDTPIAVMSLARAQTPSELADGPWRPDGIAYKANLALLLLLLLPLDREDPGVGRVLSELEADFPSQFIRSLSNRRDGPAGSSALFDDTFNLDLEIRTQFWILKVHEESSSANFTPSLLLEQVFLGNDLDKLRGWQSVQVGSLPKKARNRAFNRIGALRSCLNQELDQLVDLEKLDQLFPWSNFVSALSKWCRLRADEIDSQLIGQGGINQVVQSVRLEANKRSPLPKPKSAKPDSPSRSMPSFSSTILAARPEPQSLPTTQPLPSTSLAALHSPANIEILKNFHKIAAQRTSTKRPSSAIVRPRSVPKSTVVASNETPEQVRADQAMGSEDPFRPPAVTRKQIIPETRPEQEFDDQQLNIGGDEDFQLGEPSTGDQLTSSVSPAPIQWAKDLVAQLKKGSIFDRQENAQRISFDSPEPTPNAPESDPQDRRRGKRRARDEDDDGGDDFQTDERNQNIAEKRRKKPAQRVSYPSLQQQQAEEDAADQSTQGSRTALEDRSREPMSREIRQREQEEIRERDRLASRSLTQPRSRETSTALGPSYREINREAREFTATYVSSKQQIRVPWSKEECDILLDGIAKLGTHWARIKSWDAAEHRDIMWRRDQVGLKDKARNMKVDWIKSKGKQKNVKVVIWRDLPENFDRVPLSAKEKQKLESVGFSLSYEYDQVLDSDVEVWTIGNPET